VELTVAVAIMATVFAAVVPLFAGIRKSAEVHWAGLEMLQNARVLNDYLHRHLATTRRLVAVSDGTGESGYIEFESGDGRVYRLQVGRENRLLVGPPGELNELVGPVEYLRFTCYGGMNADEPTCVVSAIRLVTWEAKLLAPSPSVEGRVVQGACCLRIGAGIGDGPASERSS